MKKAQINNIWYWVSDHYPQIPYNKILIGPDENPYIPRLISVYRLWKRLTKTERQNLITSDLPSVKRFLEDMKMLHFAGIPVDLDDIDLVEDVNAAETAGLLDYAGRAAEILS